MRTGILSGKTALVTGASRGIGRAIARRLAAAGATVVVTARSYDQPVSALPGTLMETVAIIESERGRAIALAADLEAPEQRDSLITRAAELADNLQILVNSAGFAHLCPVESMPMSMFDLTVDHFLRIPFVLTQSAIPLMRSQGGGWIVNIGSGIERMPPLPFNEIDSGFGANVLGAVKLGLHRLTVGLAAELEQYNIAVNMAIPSMAVSTPGGDRHNLPNWPREPIENIAEAVFSHCYLPAKSRTGIVAYSAEFRSKEGVSP